MALQYYEPINHTNTVNTEVDVVSLTSTNEEPKKIVAIGILKETNAGILRGYHERDNHLEIPTAYSTESGIMEYPVDLDLPVGETFALTLQNEAAGVHAQLQGYIRYELV